MQKRVTYKFLNKRGTLIIRQMLIHLGMLGLLVVVYFLLDSYVNSIRQDTEFEMTFFSRDLALLANTLYSAPGNVDYIYSVDKLSPKFQLFRFEFKELSSSDDKSILKVQAYERTKSYPYAKNSNDKGIYLVSETKSIKFSKIDSKLAMTKNE